MESLMRRMGRLADKIGLRVVPLQRSSNAICLKFSHFDFAFFSGEDVLYRNFSSF
jgi:hypothetical protein